MDASDFCTLATPSKSKKPPRPISKLQSEPVLDTPEKPPSRVLPNRVRNRGVALSIEEIRKVAKTRPKSPTKRATTSARKQILSFQVENPPSKSAPTTSARLPEKYETLCDFFYSLDSQLRLLKLKRQMPTLTNICSGIETLTDRRFSASHLAQLKHILPEAIEIKRLLVLDEKMSVMKPDLQVTIKMDAIEVEKRSASETKNMTLRKLFRSRLVQFIKSHPKGDEVPEEELPEPFNRSRRAPELNMAKPPTLSSDSLSSDRLHNHSSAEQQSSKASHISPFFRKSFSNKVMGKPKEIEPDSSNADASVTQQCSARISSDEEGNSVSAPSPVQFSPKSTIFKECASPSHLPLACPSATPTKERDQSNLDLKDSNLESTPARLVLTPARLMASTPAPKQEKRSYMSPDDVSQNPTNKLVRRSSRNKSLKFESPVKTQTAVKTETADNENDGIEMELEDDENYNILPKELWKSIKEKEKKAMEEKDPAISLAKRRRQIIASLPKLFNIIHIYFHSARRSVATKEELIHKIVAGHLDIVDRKEVQEQLNLMLQLVPEWISEKLASSGDLLVCVDKSLNAELIRTKLADAI